MSTIKLESVNGAVFLLSGKAYAKGEYKVIYSENGNDSNGVLLEPIKSLVTIRDKTGGMPIVTDELYTNFIDSEGDAYADFDTFTKALQALITKDGVLGFVEAGDNTSITGTGTELDPYIITANPDGSETLIEAGANITVTGNGTIATPYNVAVTIAIEDDYANDAAAAVGLIPVGGLYHTAGTVKIRLV